MSRHKRRNPDARHWSERHRKLLEATAARVLAATGAKVPRDELVNEAWLCCARHYPGPNLSGIRDFVYRAMLFYIHVKVQPVHIRHYKRGVRVNPFPDEIPESALDSVRPEPNPCDISSDAELCGYILGRLKPRQAEILRLIFIEGQTQVNLTRKWQRSKGAVSLRKRRALRAAREIMQGEGLL